MKTDSQNTQCEQKGSYKCNAKPPFQGTALGYNSFYFQFISSNEHEYKFWYGDNWCTVRDRRPGFAMQLDAIK